MNLLRTLSGTAATSIVTTVWASQATRNHGELAAVVDQDRSVRTMMEQGGMAPDAINQAIDHLLTIQSGMLSTNQVMTAIAGMFIAAASMIWLAPKPTRTIEPGAGGH